MTSIDGVNLKSIIEKYDVAENTLPQRQLNSNKATKETSGSLKQTIIVCVTIILACLILTGPAYYKILFPKLVTEKNNIVNLGKSGPQLNESVFLFNENTGKIYKISTKSLDIRSTTISK